MDNNIPLTTFVLPCLNEERTLPGCLSQIRAIEKEYQLNIEIVVADNGSEDNSREIARYYGAHVVNVAERGYGSALISGCALANGEFVVMGDADGSYDFNDAVPMLLRLAEGVDLVIGTRLRGEILEDAMPWLHRYIGNPILTGMLNILFRAKYTDAHSGLRAFRKTAFEKMMLRSSGMEFASEMLVKASLLDLVVAELPIRFSPDGRDRKPHLRPWQDGWRHLKLLILFSPEALYLLPGIFFLFFGLIINIALNLIPPEDEIWIGSFFIGTHWVIPATLSAALGMQMIWLGVLSKLYSIKSGIAPHTKWFTFFWKRIYIEQILALGLLMVVLGLLIETRILFLWISNNFGVLAELRLGVLGMMWFVLGLEMISNAFFYDLLSSGKYD